MLSYKAYDDNANVVVAGVARAAQSGGGIDGGHPGLLLSQVGSECCLNYCLITV